VFDGNFPFGRDLATGADLQSFLRIFQARKGSKAFPSPFVFLAFKS
jgi:hypothetical protein